MMGTSEILKIDESGQTFYFPPSHRAALTGSKFAMSADIPLLAQSHMQLMKAFKQDGPRGNYCNETVSHIYCLILKFKCVLTIIAN